MRVSTFAARQGTERRYVWIFTTTLYPGDGSEVRHDIRIEYRPAVGQITTGFQDLSLQSTTIPRVRALFPVLSAVEDLLNILDRIVVLSVDTQCRILDQVVDDSRSPAARLQDAYDNLPDSVLRQEFSEPDDTSFP